MRGYLFILSILAITQLCIAQQKEIPFLEKVQIGLVWGEIGPCYSFRERKLKDLPYGLAEYKYYTKTSAAVAATGLCVYYKDKIGIETAFCMYEFSSDDSYFHNYIEQQYPNHYTSSSVGSSGISINSWALRLCYRKHFKHFFIEPKFQLCLNGTNQSYPTFRLKEKGSNQYIQYTMDKTNTGRLNSYHLMFCAAKRLNPTQSTFKLEVGIKTEFFVAPVEETVTITEQPYGLQASSTSTNIKSMNPGFSFGLMLKWIFAN